MKEFLSQSGIDVDNLPKETLNKLINIASKISDPESPSGVDLNALQNILNPKKENTQKKKKKIKPNVKCPCGSNKKYKKCCGKIK